MTYLPDTHTHTLPWSIGQSHRLSTTARDLIRNRANDVVVSSVSLWEISLKYGIGKLVLGSMAPGEIPGHCESLGFRIVRNQGIDKAGPAWVRKSGHARGLEPAVAPSRGRELRRRAQAP